MSKSKAMTWREFNKAINGYYKGATEEQISNYEEIVDGDRICHNPDLSIIVLAYNHEKWVDECINSLVCQKTRFSYEIILAEDCSTDGTLAICKKYQEKYPDKVRVLAARANYHGIGNGIRAHRAARGRYISWCEGDDHWLTDDKIEKQISYLEAHPECGMVASRYRVVNAQHVFQYEAPDKAFASRSHKLQRDGFVFCHISTWCMRRSLYEKINEITTAMGASADIIMLTLAEGMSQIYIMPDVFSEYHLTGFGVWTSLSEDMKWMKSIRGTINRIRFFPKSTRGYLRWNLFIDYYTLAKASLKSGRFWWLINSLIRSVMLLLLHPMIARYYYISKRRSRDVGNR